MSLNVPIISKFFRTLLTLFHLSLSQFYSVLVYGRVNDYPPGG